MHFLPITQERRRGYGEQTSKWLYTLQDFITLGAISWRFLRHNACRAVWPDLDAFEYATLELVDSHYHRCLLEPIGDLPAKCDAAQSREADRVRTTNPSRPTR
jgi:hypothetical protein